jgi:hypothetical protein
MAGIVIYLPCQYEYVEDRTMLVRDVTDRGLYTWISAGNICICNIKIHQGGHLTAISIINPIEPSTSAGRCFVQR